MCATSARAEVIARRIRHPHAIAWASAGRALVAHNGQRYVQAIPLCEHAIALFREACTDIAWEVASMQAWWLLSALFLTGDIQSLRRSLPRCIGEAEALGDRYMATVLSVYMGPTEMMLSGRPREAALCAEDALSRWSSRGFHSVHSAGLWARINSAIYLGEGRRAHQIMEEQRKALEASFLLRAKTTRIRLHDARARAMLAAAREDKGASGPLLRGAARLADELEKDGAGWSSGHASAIRGALGARRGDEAQAIAHYDRARASFLSRDMLLFARSVERHIADLERDAKRAAEVDAWMRGQGIHDPERAAATLVPT